MSNAEAMVAEVKTFADEHEIMIGKKMSSFCKIVFRRMPDVPEEDKSKVYDLFEKHLRSKIDFYDITEEGVVEYVARMTNKDILGIRHMVCRYQPIARRVRDLCRDYAVDWFGIQVTIYDGKIVGYLTTRQFAEKMGVEPNLVRQWIHRKKIVPAFKIGIEHFIAEDTPRPDGKRGRKPWKK